MAILNKPAEYDLWFRYIEERIADALGGFNIPRTDNKADMYGTIREQYEGRRKSYKKKNRSFRDRRELHGNKNDIGADCVKARYFLESSSFNEVCYLVNYDTHFVNRTFSFVQDAIYYEKKLWDEFKRTS